LAIDLTKVSKTCNHIDIHRLIVIESTVKQAVEFQFDLQN